MSRGAGPGPLSRRRALLGLLAAPLALQGCGGPAQADRPPDIAFGEDRCARCGMIISKERYAAGFVPDGGGDALTFDGPGEMMETLSEQHFPAGRVWVHDAGGAWIDGTTAFYVAGPPAKTPMGTGLVAFGDRADAEAHAAGQWNVLSWAEVKNWRPPGTPAAMP